MGWFDRHWSGEWRQGHGAAHMAQAAIVASRAAFTIVLSVAGVRVLIILSLRLLGHLMLRVLTTLRTLRFGRVVLAKRHRRRRIALQR